MDEKEKSKLEKLIAQAAGAKLEKMSEFFGFFHWEPSSFR